MNEFVKDGENGLLVRVARVVQRPDNIAFPETLIDVNDLAAKMAFLASRPQEIVRMGDNAIRFVRENLSLKIFRWRLNNCLSQVVPQVAETLADVA